MKLNMEYDTYVEIMEDIISLIWFKQMEGYDVKREFGLLKCMRGVLKKSTGITINVKKNSLGEYYLSRKEDKEPKGWLSKLKHLVGVKQ